MANERAIAAVSKAILGLIEDHCPKELLVNPSFKLYHGSDYDTPMTDGFSVLLYHVSVNSALRNLPPRRAADGKRYRPSLPLDLHYLITPWAQDPEQQQLLLGWSMRYLEDLSVIPAGVINSYSPQAEIFRAEEAVELICNPLALTDHINLWDKLKPKMQASVSYAARMVLLDSAAALREAPEVQTRDLKGGELVDA